MKMQEWKKAVKPALSIKHILIKFGKQERKKKRKKTKKTDRQGNREGGKQEGRREEKKQKDKPRNERLYMNKVGDANNTSQI